MVWYSSIAEELEDVDFIISSSLASVGNPEINEMCSYILGSGGKKIRPAVCILSHLACGDGDMEKTKNVAAAFEMIHNATLIHDDINDRSEIRRGRRTLHKQYTVSKAIVAGDLLFAIGFKLVGTTTGMVIDAVVDASSAMADSEFIQKDLEHEINASIDDYIRIIKGKTAMPIQACSKIGAILASADKDIMDSMAEYGLKIGLAFQIIDDLLDVDGDPNTTGKAIGLDLMEGKPTMPVIFAMQDPVRGGRMKEIFKNSDVTEDDIKEAIEIINSTDSVEKSMKMASKFVKEAIDALDCIPASRYRDSMVQLAEYVLSRNR